MSKISNIKIDQNTYDIRATAIPYGVVDDTSTSTAYTVTVPGITELTEGVCCLIKNGKVTSESGFTLNVNGLGAKPIYSNMATGNSHTPTASTRDTTIFNINYTMLFIYTTSLHDVPTGAWICYRGYDANTNTIGYQLRHNSSTLPASDKFYRYRLLFTSADGNKFVPANTSTSTNATSSRTVNQRPIDPFGEIVYYGSTTTISAGANPAATVLWDEYTLSLGYSFNRTEAALVLTYPKPVYIKCAPQTDGSVIIDEDTPYVQTLPSTNDGKIYIFLGIAYSATNIELLPNHPVYYHDGTGIRIWTGKTIPSKTSELTNDSNFVQSTSLATVATSGSYNDLSNKPTIPTLPDNIVINQDPDEDYTGQNIPIFQAKPQIYCEVRPIDKNSPQNVLVIKGAQQFLTSEYTPILMRRSTKSSGRGWHYCGRIGTNFRQSDITIEDISVVGNNFRTTSIEKCLTIEGECDILPYLSSVKGALASQGYINDDYYHPNGQPRRLMYVPHGKRQITLLRANNDGSVFKTNFKARWGISFIKSSEVYSLNQNTRLDVSKLVTSIAEFKIFYRWNKPQGSSNTFLLKTLII